MTMEKCDSLFKFLFNVIFNFTCQIIRINYYKTCLNKVEPISGVHIWNFLFIGDISTIIEEVIKDLPTTIISASEDIATAEEVQRVFNTERMRVYTNDDIHGVELCGALKNVLALASGIATGLGCGDNARAALITRGIAELSRLGKAMGCREQTFSGLAGVGDIIVTATSMHSRNNRCGMLIGQGVAVEDAIKQVGMVVEGLHALPAAMALAKKYDVEMPIVETVNSVVSGEASVGTAIDLLMSRELKAESADSANGLIYNLR